MRPSTQPKRDRKEEVCWRGERACAVSGHTCAVSGHILILTFNTTVLVDMGGKRPCQKGQGKPSLTLWRDPENTSMNAHADTLISAHETRQAPAFVRVMLRLLVLLVSLSALYPQAAFSQPQDTPSTDTGAEEADQKSEGAKEHIGGESKTASDEEAKEEAKKAEEEPNEPEKEAEESAPSPKETPESAEQSRGEERPQEEGPQEEGPDTSEDIFIDEVVITGSRTLKRLSDATVATEVISRSEIERSGAFDAADLLEDHPGIDITRSYAGAGIEIQGLDSEYVLILVDGERAIGRISGVVDLTRFPVEQIERIEIVKGPASALYGADALGGVVNIITRETKDDYEGEATASYGGANTLDTSLQFGLKLGDWSTRLAGGWHQFDAWDLDPETPQTSGSASKGFNLSNQTRFSPSSDFSLTSRVQYDYRDRNGIDSNSAGAVFDRRNLTETLTASLTPRLRFPSLPSELRLTAYYSLFRDQYVLDQRNSSALDKDEEHLEHIGQISAQYDQVLGDDHFMTLGLEGFYEHLRSSRLNAGSGERYRGGLYAQDEWTISEEPLFVVVPGVRLDIDTLFGVHATPKLAIRFDPHETLTLRTSYGMGYRAPVFKELYMIFENPSVGYVVEGNPDLKPETSHSVNVQVEYKPTGWLWFSTSYYRNEVSNLITTATIDEGSVGPNRFSYLNLASAYTQGSESSIRVKPKKSVTFEASYTLTDTWDKESKRALEGKALHRATFQFDYAHSVGLDMNLRASVVGPRPYYIDIDNDGSEEEVSAPTYAVLDARLAQGIGEHLTLFIGVDNILNAGNPTYLPIQPRFFYGGVSGRL